ncbi:MAG: hypothetical protein LBK25_09040 [Treponema sp.]|nr:hypothetical protein [Treponema sp.]
MTKIIVNRLTMPSDYDILITEYIQYLLCKLVASVWVGGDLFFAKYGWKPTKDRLTILDKVA